MKTYGANEYTINISHNEYKNIMLGWQTFMPRFKDGLWNDVKRYDIINIISKNGSSKIRIEDIYEYSDVKTGMNAHNFMSVVPTALHFNDAYNYVIYCLRNSDWNNTFLILEIKVVE